MTEKLRIACERSVVRRATVYAVVVGAILITINHGDAILQRDIDGVRLAKMCLTVLVPYLVSTFSSVGTLWQVRTSRQAAQAVGREAAQ